MKDLQLKSFNELDKETIHNLDDRHFLTNENYLHSVVSMFDKSWAVAETSLDDGGNLVIHNVEPEVNANTLIASAIYTLQHRLDYEIGRTSGRAKKSVGSGIRHLSVIMSWASGGFLDCHANEQMANRIIDAAHSSFQRIQGGISSGEDLYRVSRELMEIGCARVLANS